LNNAPVFGISVAMQLNRRFEEKVYAGVVGKLIGVYLGRPFEGWDNAAIESRLGTITDYVHEELGARLIVTDDDISGTFTFVRAFEDFDLDFELSARAIGQTWLNYIIENRSILWWGGMGNSTEHTAYLHLKNGMDAPFSGAIETNGRVVAEQIGAQIFIDGWAMLCPGDPERAVDLARRAASVSHDGEAIAGAQVLAAMEAQAFVADDINELLDTAVELIERDSLIVRLIDDIRDWHAKNPDDWRASFAQIQNQYGYDRYGGNCHMVPNHGLIVMALLHSNGDFSRAMEVVNTAGWDTDCNSGNLGCLMGIRGGIDGLPAALRDPVADRCYLPTADGSRAVTDAWTESQRLIAFARGAQDKTTAGLPAETALNFNMPGAVQGFQSQQGDVRQVSTSPTEGALLIAADNTGSGLALRDVFVDSLATSKYFHKAGYALMATPQLNPGQKVVATISSATGCSAALCIAVFNADDEIDLIAGETFAVGADAQTVEFVVPDLAGFPIAQVGVQVQDGAALLHDMQFLGSPSVTLSKTVGGSMWSRAWVNGVDVLWNRVEPFRLIQNSGTGLLSYGCRSWQSYRVSADITPHLARRAGLAACYQGLRRYYALVLNAKRQSLQLICERYETTVLAEVPMAIEFGVSYALSLSVHNGQLNGSCLDKTLTFSDATFTSGGVALLIDQGRTATQQVQIEPVSPFSHA